MQGQRGTIGSLPEMLDFDHGSTSSDAAIDQQICWSSTRNPAENLIPDFVQSPGDMNVGFGNSMGHERQNLSRWCLGEPSSSNLQSEGTRDERKTELGWPSSVDPCGERGPRLEDRRHEPTNNLSLDNNVNTIFTQSSSSDAVPQNLNLNAGFSGHGGDNSQGMDCINTYKYNVSENERIRPSTSDPFLLPSGSSGFLLGDNDGRPGSSLEGRRVSCKRKAIEANIGQSSVSGSCSYFQHTESGARPSVPAHYNAGNSLSISAPSEQGNPRLGAGGRELTSDNLPDSNAGRSSESSHRNFRVRINPSNQQNSIPSTRFATGRGVRHSSVSSSQHPPSLLPVDHSMDLRPAPVLDNMSSQNQPAIIHVPALPQNVQSLRWSGGSSSRTSSLSNAVVFGDRDAPPREDVSSRSMSRHILEHPIFVPATELRNSARQLAGASSRNLAGGNPNIPGNVASTSRIGSSSNVHPASAPTWVPHHNSHPQFPRRLSEYVRRSLFSASGSDSGSQGANYLPLRSGPASSQEVGLSSGAGNQGHHHSHSRSAAWMERHGDGGLGVPYSLRTLAAAGEGSNRLVSEICNVLGLMRRGEGLRFEDVMILDQSVLFGVADIHDRHRDMRLDVDNMSYEELLALEERIGNVSTGLNEETISNRLKHKKYIAVGSQAETEPCCVCQEEYNEGEDLGMLECGHDFHSACIKQWLMHKNLCPICKTTALST